MCPRSKIYNFDINVMPTSQYMIEGVQVLSCQIKLSLELYLKSTHHKNAYKRPSQSLRAMYLCELLTLFF